MTSFATSILLLEPHLIFAGTSSWLCCIRRKWWWAAMAVPAMFYFCWNHLRFLLEPLFLFATNRGCWKRGHRGCWNPWCFLLLPAVIFAGTGVFFFLGSVSAVIFCWNQVLFLLEPVICFAAMGGILCWNWCFLYLNWCQRWILLEPRCLFCWKHRCVLLPPTVIFATWYYHRLWILLEPRCCFAGNRDVFCCYWR